MGGESEPTRPWWVWLAVTDPLSPRRSIVRTAWVLAVLLGGIACPAALLLAFFLGDPQLSPHRGWVAAVCVGLWALIAWNFLAIRWMDRANAWKH